jgi:hypothetical protein
MAISRYNAGALSGIGPTSGNLTQDIDVGSDSNRVLYLLVSAYLDGTSETGVAVTAEGTAMNSEGSVQVPNAGGHNYAFSLSANEGLASGSAVTLVISHGAGSYFLGGAYYVAHGAQQSNIPDALTSIAETRSGAVDLSMAVTPTTTGCWCAFLGHANLAGGISDAGDGYVLGGGATSQAHADNHHVLDSNGTVTQAAQTWTIKNNDHTVDWGGFFVSIAPAGATPSARGQF